MPFLCICLWLSFSRSLFLAPPSSFHFSLSPNIHTVLSSALCPSESITHSLSGHSAFLYPSVCIFLCFFSLSLSLSVFVSLSIRLSLFSLSLFVSISPPLCLSLRTVANYVQWRSVLSQATALSRRFLYRYLDYARVSRTPQLCSAVDVWSLCHF